jgi:hypothetical protein
MLLALGALLLALWLVTMAMSATLGGVAHLLLIAALALILFHAWQTRNPA